MLIKHTLFDISQNYLTSVYKYPSVIYNVSDIGQGVYRPCCPSPTQNLAQWGTEYFLRNHAHHPLECDPGDFPMVPNFNDSNIGISSWRNLPHPCHKSRGWPGKWYDKSKAQQMPLYIVCDMRNVLTSMAQKRNKYLSSSIGFFLLTGPGLTSIDFRDYFIDTKSGM